MRKEKIKRNLPVCLIALILSAAAFAFLPGVVNAGIGKGSENLMTALLGLVFSFCAVIALTAFLRYRENKNRGERFFASLARVFMLVPMYLAVSLVTSILSGIMAVLVYGALSAVLSLDQIKGIIDLLTTILMLLIMPIMVSLFWTQIRSAGTFGAAVKSGMRSARKSYLGILIGMLVCVGAGWLILTVFHYLPENRIATVAKTLIFGAIGTATLTASEKSCKKGAYHR